ncbi:MAG: ABC transporter permease, partial [Bacteroidota bacterium]|nr:ABC transporter permease [Bacteroidota bacterium]
MNRFIAFVIKEFHHITRDYRTLIILFGIPIAQILIFGYVVKSEIKDVNIAVFDKSKDVTTLRITNKLISSGYFLLNKNLDNTKDAEEIFKRGDVKMIVVFDSDFDKKMHCNEHPEIQLLADASDPNQASLIVNYTTVIINNFLKEEFVAYDIPLQVTPQVRMFYNEEMRSVFMFVPGTMAMILMLISAMMTSVSIAKEKELGTMENLLVSPLQPIQIIIGKVTPYLFLSIVNAVSILALGYFVFGLPIRGSLLLLMGETILFIFLSLSLGILISTVSSSQQAAMFISMFALLLPVLLLSGFIYPIENMPEILQWLTYVMPPRYFIVILKNIMLKGTGFMFVWKETLIIIGFTIVFIAISVKKFKLR